MEQAGLVLTALAGLWVAYLVPQLLRHRRQLVEARVDDRFSEHLRVLRVATPAATGTHAPSSGRVQLHPRGGDRAMHRPQSVADRVTADAVWLTASERSARAASLSRRAAAARRRARLTFGLLVLSGAAWVAVGAASWPVAVAAAPTLLLAAVLVAGRRAVLAGHRADAAWAADAPVRAARPRPVRAGALAVGRAPHPSEAITEVLAKVPTAPVRAAAAEVLATGQVPVVPAAEVRPAGDVVEPDAAAWVPVPVPRPTYALKPEARRPEPRPLTGPTPAVAPAAAQATPTTGGLELDAILARRRAAGE